MIGFGILFNIISAIRIFGNKPVSLQDLIKKYPKVISVIKKSLKQALYGILAELIIRILWETIKIILEVANYVIQ